MGSARQVLGSAGKGLDHVIVTFEQIGKAHAHRWVVIHNKNTRSALVRPPREDRSGWGLFLVQRLAERWGVHHGDGHTQVWFELPRA